MTVDDILIGIDESLAAIAAETERLLVARVQLTGTAAPAVATPRRRTPSRSSRRPRGGARTTVLEALDVDTPRTAGDIAKLTNVPRARAGTTLSRLVKQGKATKADRGYIRVAA